MVVLADAAFLLATPRFDVSNLLALPLSGALLFSKALPLLGALLFSKALSPSEASISSE